MSSIVVCASGFSPSEKLMIEKKVLELGGVFEADLTTIASVLIASRQGTLKSTTSSEILRIPVVTEEWLTDSYKKQSFSKNYERYKLPPLFGLKIWTYKLENSRKVKIKKLGGILACQQSNDLFCIITEPEHQKLLKLCMSGFRITTTVWLDKIIQEKRWIEPDSFSVESEEPVMQEYYLSHGVFYLHELAEEEGKIVKEVIILGGGTYLNSWNTRATHVVSYEDKKGLVNACRITPKELMELCLNKKL